MDELDKATILNNDGLLGATRGFLYLSAVMYLVIGCGGGYQLGIDTSLGLPKAASVALGLVAALAGFGVAVVDLVAARGLAAGRAWAWYLSVGIAILNLPTCCLPIGAVMLYGLVRTPVRRAYGVARG